MFFGLFKSKKKSKPTFPTQENPWESPLPFNLTIVNFDTANRNKGSICRIGLVIVSNQQYYVKTFYVKPKTNTFSMSKKNHITADTVKDSPSFSQVWPSILPYFENQNVAVFYADFHKEALLSALKKNNLPIPNWKTFTDLYHFALELAPNEKHHSLDDVWERYDLPAHLVTFEGRLLTIYDFFIYLYQEYPRMFLYIDK